LLLESLLNNLESYLNVSLTMSKYQQFLKELPFYDYNRYEGLGFTKQCYEYIKSKDIKSYIFYYKYICIGNINQVDDLKKYESFINQNIFDDAMLLIMSENLEENDIINYFIEAMLKFPIPSEWQKFYCKTNELLEMCNIMSMNLVNTDILFETSINKIKRCKGIYWLKNRNSIKDQNKNKLNEMWDKNILKLLEQVGSIDAHDIYLNRLKHLIESYFSTKPFLKCYECRNEAYIEWVNDKDIHANYIVLRNLSEIELKTRRDRETLRGVKQMNDAAEALLNDCMESSEKIKLSIQAQG
jgi:hypothetical protein